MKSINEIFFSLIRVAIGTEATLPLIPSADEWSELYAIVQKQALLGITFAGVQKLSINQPSLITNLSDHLRLQWMGMAAKIQQRNDIVNQQCVGLQSRLSADGFRSCILKGQGVAQLYGSLVGLRQSGDIDIWIEGGLNAVLNITQKYGIKPIVAEHHVELPLFKDTDVEAHFTPSYMRCPWHNRMLQRWMIFENCVSKEVNGPGMTVPTTEFNLIFLMLHAYRHMTSEGVGLRQVMDYYFVLKNASNTQKRQALMKLREFGVGRFCGAMMYVLQKVFGMEQEYLLCEPNMKEGGYLLNEIMMGGNFGHYDKRIKKSVNESKMARFLRQTQRNLHQFTHYPTESFFSPWWRAKIWIWRKWNGWI